jgi:hypothetical protein
MGAVADPAVVASIRRYAELTREAEDLPPTAIVVFESPVSDLLTDAEMDAIQRAVGDRIDVRRYRPVAGPRLPLVRAMPEPDSSVLPRQLRLPPPGSAWAPLAGVEGLGWSR